MATHASARKRARQSLKKAARNRALKSRVSNTVKKFNALVAQGKKEEATKMLPGVVREIDGAWAKGIMKRQTASRKIARLQLHLAAGK